MQRHDAFHLHAIKAAWGPALALLGTPATSPGAAVGMTAPAPGPACTSPTATTLDPFDAFMVHWMASYRVPFVHGVTAADTDLTATALGTPTYHALQHAVAAALAATAHPSLLAYTVAHEPLAATLARLLPHVKPDTVLVDATNFSHTAAFFFPNYESVLKHLRAEAYNNKKIVQRKKRERTLALSRLELDRARQVVAATAGAVPRGPARPGRDATVVLRIVALDIEAYEFNHKLLTEIGYSVADVVVSSPYLTPCATPPSGGTETASRNPSRSAAAVPETWHAWPTPESTTRLQMFHCLVEEHLALRNGVRVADAKDAFLGASVTAPLATALATVADVIRSADILVGHAVASDLQFLKRERVRFPTVPMAQAAVRDAAAVSVADTQSMYKALTGSVDCVRLAKVLDHVQVGYDPARLHNAGNDAWYTLLAFMTMAAGAPRLVSPVVADGAARAAEAGANDDQEEEAMQE
ncbi:hypothetical protein AMAG_04300 [Allomyces macrogynus ATCC 38327]|uniref:Gfd2/YDR514C-like C-terminal domain-containing protein n=1 Tax=Allomyces macrogynus (strain ATCC 38327) TaxID=578462 RepID=A0A0L0S8J8_ALLM3|nr:hypothetical protein AMAG_04300 [Allomyces macrogynus ATCC 38327]|eukprot:KNE58746.1 hypothetical protein AMAG_04300 [Allomyces macrogynus ATCC 38327]